MRTFTFHRIAGLLAVGLVFGVNFAQAQAGTLDPKFGTDGTVTTIFTGAGSPVELLEFFAQKRACDDRDREIVCSDVRAFGAGNQECVAGGDAVVASARMVVGKVNHLLRAHAPLLLADNSQTTNNLSRTGLE